MKINKIVILGVIIILVVGFFIMKQPNNKSDSSDQSKIVQTSGLTTIKLSALPNGTYSPQLIKVKSGTKVRIEGDPKTLSGGMDTVIIDDLNINQKISKENYIVEFVAGKTGKFRMRCANNMGNGALIVE
jgi:plastocyanin domain-containing protein